MAYCLEKLAFRGFECISRNFFATREEPVNATPSMLGGSNIVFAARSP